MPDNIATPSCHTLFVNYNVFVCEEIIYLFYLVTIFFMLLLLLIYRRWHIYHQLITIINNIIELNIYLDMYNGYIC